MDWGSFRPSTNVEDHTGDSLWSVYGPQNLFPPSDLMMEMLKNPMTPVDALKMKLWKAALPAPGALSADAGFNDILPNAFGSIAPRGDL